MTTTIRAIFKTKLSGKFNRMIIHLPAGSAMRARWLVKNFRKANRSLVHFAVRPLIIRVFNTILPLDVIPGVDTDFMPRCFDGSQYVGATSANIGSWQ